MQEITGEVFRDAVHEVRDLGADVELHGDGDVKSIGFVGTQITDDGLATVALFKRIQRLYLGATHVSDTGLRHLHALKDLEYVSLHGTEATPGGMNELQAVLPNCKIRPRRAPAADAQPSALPMGSLPAAVESTTDVTFRREILSRMQELETAVALLKKTVEQLAAK